MVSQDFNKVIRDLLTYFQLNVKEISFTCNNVIPVVTLANKNKVLKGLRNVISEVSNYQNSELVAVQDEWSEYIETHIGYFDSFDTLKELNNHLVDKVYFVGNQFGAIDILIYYLLHQIFLNLSYQEKEKYINVSRWFNEVQQNQKARLSRPVVQFSKCCLYN